MYFLMRHSMKSTRASEAFWPEPSNPDLVGLQSNAPQTASCAQTRGALVKAESTQQVWTAA